MSETIRQAKVLWARFSGANAGTHASSISYYTFLSLVPLLIICLSLVSMTSVSQAECVEFFCAMVPEALQGLVRMLVDQAYTQSGVAFSLSTATLLWSASKGVKAIRVGLNAVYAKQEERTGWQVMIISMIGAIVLVVLLAAVIYLVFSGTVLRALAQSVPDIQAENIVVSHLNTVATLGLGILSLTACYAFLPAGRRRFLDQLPGAVCAAAAWVALSFGFRIYVDKFCNFAVLYGSIATVALLLFWMYLLFYILLICGFINRILAERKERQRSSRRASR